MNNIFLVGARGSKIEWIKSILNQEYNIEVTTLNYSEFKEKYSSYNNSYNDIFILIKKHSSHIIDTLTQEGIFFEKALKIFEDDVVLCSQFDITNKVNYIIKDEYNDFNKIILQIIKINEEVHK